MLWKDYMSALSKQRIDMSDHLITSISSKFNAQIFIMVKNPMIGSIKHKNKLRSKCTILKESYTDKMIDENFRLQLITFNWSCCFLGEFDVQSLTIIGLGCMGGKVSSSVNTETNSFVLSFITSHNSLPSLYIVSMGFSFIKYEHHRLWLHYRTLYSAKYPIHPSS